ncbi:hypothetical protein HOLleu_26324 [Holothuria leucospilota]|uniref:Uncharacterized protein n=1 Tax=Holothuria leucospilota TaxID=206669 RepID=A0A9Q1H4M2_HOLLE|nr:hypothetical protein HOLleu_26324 [Holothuria leucospilota]
MTPVRRLEVVKEKRPCFNCLDFSNHVSRECRGPKVYDENGCRGKHSSLLHQAVVAARNKSLKEERLKLHGNKTTLSLETLNEGRDAIVVEVSLEVTTMKEPKEGRKVVKLPRVYAIANFPKLRNSVPSRADVMKWYHLKYLKVWQVSHSGVTLIIGQDVPDALVPLEVRNGRHGEPYDTRTVLGWTLNGPLRGDNSDESVVCNFIQANQAADAGLETQVEHFWKLDVGQTLAGSITEMSQDDKRTIKIMAEKRLQNLGRRLAKNPGLYKCYMVGIGDLIQQGYAEKVPENKLNNRKSGMTWYLPHHNVVNPNKPGKLRIVFDCAAEYIGTPLNKQVLQGPDMTNKLIGVLLRFREEKVAVMGDIQAMFHQVRVSPQHRVALKFLC